MLSKKEHTKINIGLNIKIDALANNTEVYMRLFFYADP